ncbi:hypothetical protein SH203_02671 [Brevundimonas sp. SH203]|uniref:hypothetical protein n=1 Tax=Brevundimonas sp. SH203 TaxID=345167 RepID=UPI0009D3186D|nr:hypothetical protein [Brevundimonas sp. SH203]GAW42255.1 hypothetical protein SH203_02671 [Brevundimonas sp. SH203]
MSLRLRLAPLALAACLIPCAVQAQAHDGGRFAVGAQIGTPGAGLQAQWALSPKLVLRGGYDVLNWDRDQSYKGIDYDAKIDFKSPGAFVDLHPFENGFLVSGGAYFGARRIDLDATPTSNVNVGGAVFTPAQVGTLTGRIDLAKTAPFVGVGYDNTFALNGRLGFRVLAGAAFGDKPKVDLDARGGTLSNDPVLRARLDDEEREIQDEADKYKVLPVVQAGLNFRF